MAGALGIHLLAAVFWTGGMMLMLLAVRPAAIVLLDPPLRIPLLCLVLQRFFIGVWISVLLLLSTGFWMLFAVFGGPATAAWHIHLMLALGLLMIALFSGLWLVPYRRLRRAVEDKQWPQAGRQLELIRRLVSVNLSLAVIVVLAASGGRYL